MSAHSKTIGLSKNRHQVYRFRIKIPTQIRKYFHRNEINKSLDTKDAQTAQNKAILLYDKYQKLLKVIEMSVLSDDQIQELVDNFIIEALKQDKLDRANNGFGSLSMSLDGTYDGDYAEAMKAEIDSFYMDYKKDLANCEYDAMLPTAKSLLESLDISFDSNEPTHKLFLQSLMRGMVEILEEAKNRYSGNFNPKYDTPKARAITKKRIKKEYKTYKQAYERFKRYYDTLSISQATKDDTFRVIDKLLIMVGEDTCIEETDLDDMLDIQEAITRLPNMNLSRYNTMEFKDILELTTIPVEDNITDSRVKGYIKHIKKFFSFCHAEQIISYDPSVRITVTVEGNKKDPFSDDEMRKLIDIVKALTDDTKYLYMSYIFTGMRREELYNCTIEEVGGIKYFNILKGKNTSSVRIVPLHNELIDMGMNNEKLSSAKSLISFNNLGRRFNEKIKIQVTESNKKTLHSLRHNVATKLQDIGVLDETIRTIIGHSAQDTLNKVYTASHSATVTVDKAQKLKEAIDKLNY